MNNPEPTIGRLRRNLHRARRASILVGAVAALVIGLGSGAAFAYFTSVGSGSGRATTGTAKRVTVIAATGTVKSKMIPGGSADLLVELDNPNSFPVVITDISQNGALSVVGGTNCTAANSGVSVPTQSGLDVTIPTGDTLVHVPNGASMSSTSNSGCQGASFELPISLTVHSS